MKFNWTNPDLPNDRIQTNQEIDGLDAKNAKLTENIEKYWIYWDLSFALC